MNREDIIAMAREAGLFTHKEVQPELERFAKLVRDDYSNKHAQLWLDRVHKFMLAEREACANVAEHTFVQEAYNYPEAIAAAIRARKD